MAQFIDIVSWIAILVGAFFSITGAVGLFRLPDFYSRIHAAGMQDTLGVPMFMLGMMLQNGWDINTAKYFFILLFIYYSGPTATYALAKAALHGGVPPVIGEKNNTNDKAAS